MRCYAIAKLSGTVKFLQIVNLNFRVIFRLQKWQVHLSMQHVALLAYSTKKKRKT